MVSNYNRSIVEHLLEAYPMARSILEALPEDEPKEYGELRETVGIQAGQLEEILNQLLGVGAVIREEHHDHHDYVRVYDLQRV